MERKAHSLIKSVTHDVHVTRKTGVTLASVGKTAAVLVVILMVFYNLGNYPLTWFDEGSHLHVPKTLVRFGVYADYSSEGFRDYGPTIGVGPTVMLPVAASFRLLGTGLLQARLVMALYLLLTILAFFRLAKHLGGRRLAWVATALLISSQGVALLEYGRQVLGEVPGLFFTLAGLVLWFRAWERPGWRHLLLPGLLFGLAMVTKHQYLLLLAPTLGLAWLANRFYYRRLPHRVFIIPGLIAGVSFVLWQLYLILYLGPATASENLAMFREFTAGAAAVLSPDLMKQSLKELLSLKVYLGWLIPSLVYGAALAIPRGSGGQRWGTLLILAFVNLVWYVVASIGWLRYAFPGLAVSALFVARLFSDLTGEFHLDLTGLRESLPDAGPALRPYVLHAVLIAWLAVMVLVPLGQSLRQIVAPGFNAPAAMAAYLDAHIPTDAIVETWEPEMGFLTDHNYHFPPPLLLNDAVGHIWLGGPSPASKYDFVQAESPEYILVGEFARYVELYPADLLAARYQLVTSIGTYDLYARSTAAGLYESKP